MGARENASGTPGPDGEYTLVVAVANPDNVDQLLRTAVDLAGAHDGLIRIVSVAHQPVTSPFMAFKDEVIAQSYAKDQRTVLEQAERVTEDAGVRVETSLRVASNIAEGILAEVEDAGADALLVGWQERSQPADIVLGTTIDPVFRRAPCDVLVERVGARAITVDAILLPTAGGQDILFGAELARAIARVNDASVTVLACVPPDAGGPAREMARELIGTAAAHLEGVPVREEVVETDDVAAAVVRAAGEHDLVILGASREGRFRRRIVGSTARAVGEQADPPVIIAKRVEEPRLYQRFLPW